MDDLSEGKRFKFISVEQGTKTGEIQDPTSPENGLVRVQIFPEVYKAFYATSGWTTYAIGESPSYLSRAAASPVVFNGVSSGDSSFTIPSTFCCTTISPDPIPRSMGGDLGATTEGSASNQKFTAGEGFEVESPVKFDLWIKGVQSESYPETPSHLTVNIDKKVVRMGSAAWFNLSGWSVVDNKLTVRTTEGLEIKSSSFSFV